jgi:hypothetical protein
MEFKLSKIGRGFYQVSNGEYFSNLQKIEGWHEYSEYKGKWMADIRVSRTGELVRYAGIWNTMKEAREEAEWIITRLTPQSVYER